MTKNGAPRFAMFGTGGMAAAMMSTFDHAGVRVVAVGSRDPTRGRQFADAFHIPTVGEKIDSLLRDSEFDAVYIANASAEHANTAIASLEAGKAVLCEKPLALSAGEAERVAAAATRTGKLCMEAIWISFLPAYRRFVELARTNTYGKPTHLFADFGYPVSEKARPRLFSQETGGVLSDRGIYLVALALDVFGPVEAVNAKLEVTGRGVEQHASLHLLHEGGNHSQLAASFTSLMSNTATLACTEGRIRLEEPLIGAETISIRRLTAAHDRPPDSVLIDAKQRLARSLRQSPLLRRYKRLFSNERHEYLGYGASPYLAQLLHFIELMSTGACESNVVPLQHSLSIHRILDRARGCIEPPRV